MSNASSDEVLKRPLSQVENGSIKKNRAQSDIDRSETGMSKDNASTLTDIHVEEGDGSEAETVVMPGKDLDVRASAKKTIRHEASNTTIPDGPKSDASTNGTNLRSTRQEGSTVSEKKNNKSNAESAHHLPSTSSPSHAQDQPRSRGRAASESNKTQEDPNGNAKASVSRKRKGSMDDSEDKAVKRRIKREDFDNINNNNNNHHHESRKANNHVRSESPTRHRASTNSSNPSSVQKPRRKPPPPLVVGMGAGKRMESVDAESNESHSPRRSAQPRIIHVAESEKMIKRRDKNGRTRVARACAVNNLEEVREHLKDHPEELDEPDNAGNTPLQIASLEGYTDIVRLLLKKGCKFDTENCDRDSPLIDSVENSHLDVVRLLLEAGVNPRKLNAKGEEPADLVDMEHDNGPAIKEELARYKIKYDSRRRQSTEKAPDTGKESIYNRSPRDSPSTTTRSPPPQTTRRRAGRNEATRNDLLWVTATPENLVNFAGKGDDQAIMHLLNMRPISDVEAVFAAAKGGHDSCLNLLLAMGRTVDDPTPMEDQKKGYNTPMLVAIGKGNPRVIELLLEQRDFDPTRRLYKNMTYYEIAEKRQGDGWREEYQKLKAAYDERMVRDGKKSSAKSSRTSSPKDSKKSQRDRSPSHIVRDASPSATRSEVTRKKIVGDDRSEAKSDRLPEKPRDGHVQKKTERKHLKVPRHESREGSTATSDREHSPIREREKRSASDQELVPRPRKRLVSGKDLKDAQIKQRRNSFVSTVSTGSIQDSTKSKNSQEEVTKPKRRDDNDDKGKKRLRKSSSPRPSEGTKPNESSIKRQKSKSLTTKAKPLDAAEKVSSTRGIPSTGAAPVAMMGSSNLEKKDTKLRSKDANGVKDKIKTDHGERARIKVREKPSKHDPAKIELELTKSKESKSHVKEDLSWDDRNDEGSHVDNEEHKNGIVVQKAPDSPPIKLDPDSHEHNIKQLSNSPTSEMEMDMDNQIVVPSLEESSFMEIDKMGDQSEQPIEATETAVEEPSLNEDSKNAEELAQDLEHQETIRKQAAQEESRRNEELAQQEARREYLRSLPRRLKNLLESPENAKSEKEITSWLPLKCAIGIDVNPDCQENEREEQWITNIQAAAILVDCGGLELEDFPAWTRIPVVDSLKFHAWRHLRGYITDWSISDASDIQTANFVVESHQLNKIYEKQFLALNTFWVRLSDFESVVQLYPHLQNHNLHTQNMITLRAHAEAVRKIEEAENRAPDNSNSPWKALFASLSAPQSPNKSVDQAPAIT